jgi:hypothetical protein
MKGRRIRGLRSRTQRLIQALLCRRQQVRHTRDEGHDKRDTAQMPAGWGPRQGGSAAQVSADRQGFGRTLAQDKSTI